MEVSTIWFAIFNPEITYRVFLSGPGLPRCDHCPELLPLMPFTVVSSDVAAICCLRPLFPCCLPGMTVFSSRVSVPSWFLVQPCPCLVPEVCVHCAVPLLHSGLSLCGWRPISSGTYPLASCGALLLDSNLCAASLIL
jgi:hypothetical protein